MVQTGCGLYLAPKSNHCTIAIRLANAYIRNGLYFVDGGGGVIF